MNESDDPKISRKSSWVVSHLILGKKNAHKNLGRNLRGKMKNADSALQIQILMQN